MINTELLRPGNLIVIVIISLAVSMISKKLYSTI